MQTWTRHALVALEAEAARAADTHPIRLGLPAFPGIPLCSKGESAHSTGSSKHRPDGSLFPHAICNGWLREDRPVVTPICDGGEHCAGSCDDDAWLAAEQPDVAPALARLKHMVATGTA